MIRNISSSVKSVRKGGWEDAMLRLASFSKCLVSFDIRGREAFDGKAGKAYFEFKVAFTLSIISGKTFPRIFKLKYPDLASWRGAYELRSENFTRHTLENYYKTKAAACKRYLTMVAGKTLGVCDSVPPSRYGGYSVEIFMPVLTVPEFSSLKELNLKLSVIGA